VPKRPSGTWLAADPRERVVERSAFEAELAVQRRGDRPRADHVDLHAARQHWPLSAFN